MEQFIADVIKHFTIKGLGQASYYLGYHIAGSRKKRVLKLNKHLYVKTIGERLEVLERSMIPAVAHSVHISQANGPQTEADMPEEMLGTPYREVVGRQLRRGGFTKGTPAPVPLGEEFSFEGLFM